MGISPSKRVSGTLTNSSEFNSSCDSVYDELRSLTQHAFPGILPYQLSDAAYRLHVRLTHSLPLVSKWVPSPPSRSQVDRAYRSVTRSDSAEQPLPSDEFKAFAVELFSDAVVSNASMAVATRVPIGIAGIAGAGVVARARKDLIGTAIGVYALGLATSVYISLA